MICCIPTKGRPQTKTYKLLESYGIQSFHFIEPQEINKYNVPNKISILENNKGISYVRNFILDYAKRNNYEWIIMCDDDIINFYIYENKKNIKLSLDKFNNIIEKIKKLPFEISGFNYKQYIWVAKENYSINTKTVEQCIFMNVKKIHWKYRSEFNLKEDRDFILQTIKNGNGVLRFNKIGVSSPEIGSNDGGLKNEYKLKKDEHSAKKMIIEWRPFLSLQKKGKRMDIKMDIKSLATHYKKIIK